MASRLFFWREKQAMGMVEEAGAYPFYRSESKRKRSKGSTSSNPIKPKALTPSALT